MAWNCDDCGFELWYPIAVSGLEVTRLGLYAEDKFPGRVILALNTHAENLDLLDDETLCAMWRDAARVGGVLRNLVNAVRVNYAVLGNAVAHLHVHIIPRLETDPLPTRSPWVDDRDSAL